MAVKPDYNVGTISLAEGGTVITGVDTFWATATIQAGDELKVQNLSAIIASVDSNTQITLIEEWTGTALVAAPYRIRYQPDGSRYQGAVRDLIVELGNGNIQSFAALAGALDLIPIFTGTGALTLIPKTELIEGVQTDAKVEDLAGRAAFDGEVTGFSVLVADVGDGRSAIYFKITSTSGDWSDPAYLTGPNGVVQSQGTYNPATAYVLGQIVLQNGSSWIARVNTTGNAPPTLPTTSNTQWFLLSAAGNGFTFKGPYSGATGYLVGDVVSNQNSSWIALLSTTGNPPPTLPMTSNTQWSLLAYGAGLTFRGDYSGATAYAVNDIVINQGSSWIALLSTTGNAPPTLPATSNTQWKAIAVRGTGDLSGPASSVTGNLPKFSDPTGKVVEDSAVPAIHALKMRNYAYNPAMQASIEYGGASGTTGASATYYAEQWVSQFNTSAGVITSQRVSSFTPKGSPYRYRVTVTTADTSLAAGEFLMIRQPFEGLRIQPFRFGTASAKRMLVRFGFKGPAGTYGVTITNGPATRSYVTTFTIGAGQANTDTEQLFLIPGDTTGTWNSDNSLSGWLNITMACGTTFQGTAGVWQAGNFLGSSAVSNGMATAGNVFELFDVGVYLDDELIGVAPKFEIPDYSFNLWECQRYFEYIGMTLSTSADLTNTSWFKATKRDTPIFTLASGTLGSATIAAMGNTETVGGVRQVAARAGAADVVISANARM